MTVNKIKKFAAVYFAVFFAVVFPLVSYAQVIPLSGCTQLLPCYTSDVNSGNSLSGIGTAASNAAAVTAFTGFQATNQGYAVAEQAYFASISSSQIAFGGLNLISGGSTVQATLSQEVVKIETFIGLRQTLLATVNVYPASNLYVSNMKQTLIQQITGAINNLKSREESVKAQLKVAQEGFWKSIVIEILVQTTKSVASNLLSHLVNNYAIKDFSKYTDAVATLVYDNEYIQNNFSGNNADQLLARAFLTNPAIDQSLSPAIVQRSQEALGFTAATLSPNDPNFYTKIAQVGGVAANPYTQQIIMADQAAQIHQQALATAQNEVVQSNGLKTPRSCPGVYAQQQALDQSYKAVNDQLQNREKLLQSLQNGGGSTSDIQKAQADVAAAQQAWDKLPYDVTSSTGNAAIDICTAIVSPPSLINKGIDDALTSIDKNLGVYNSNNLPFFISFIGQIGSQIATSLIFGGKTSVATILNENKSNLTAATGLAAAYGLSQAQSSSSTPIFVAQRVDDGSNPKSSTYNLQWDANTVSGATGVIIRGPGIDKTVNNAPQASVSGVIITTLPIPGTYTFTISVYGASTLDIKATANLVITAGQAAGKVAGASAARPLSPIRGESSVSPRGSPVQASVDEMQQPASVSPRG